MKKILLVSILVLSLMLVSVGCASSSDESKIKDTVNGFFGALDDADYEEALDYIAGADEMSETEKGMVVDVFEALAPSGVEMKVKSIKDVKVDGDTATASVVVTVNGTDSPSQDIELVKEDGSWKMSGYTG